VALGLTGWAARLPDDDAGGALPMAAPVRALAKDAGVRPRTTWPEPSAAAVEAWSAPSPAAATQVAEPAPPPAAEAAAPAAPVPPALPWRWLGRLDDRAGPRALIDGPGGARLVREAEVLDGQWRVDRIAPDHLRWTWLPAGLPHTMNRS
jgi:hypothetical protein